MNRITFKLIVFILSISFFSFVFSCKNASKQGINNTTTEETALVEKKEAFFQIAQPEAGSKFSCGEKINFVVKAKNKEKIYDSILASSGGLLLDFEIQESGVLVNTTDLSPGKHRLNIKLFLPDGSHENHSVSLEFLSDIIPREYTYRLVNTYPHDIQAYTQGLEYSAGYMLEGTGAYGESSLRKIHLETGEILKFKNLPSNIFGEGITHLNGKIYQITYRAQVGFVYDARNFEQINKIYYQNKEGWGLSNNGRNIIMSDGTHLIYFMDTTYFSVERKIEVYDDKGPVNLLNELEYIHGKLYANRYTTNEIVIIDPETGKLEGRIDMSGLLKEEDKHRRIDYFNGIAFDNATGRIFVTGKYWPKLYEVEFVKK